MWLPFGGFTTSLLEMMLSALASLGQPSSVNLLLEVQLQQQMNIA